MECKRRLTSHRICTYILVTEKNQLIYNGHLSYTCSFITECLGCRNPAMKIGMHIFFLYMHAVWLQTHPFLKTNLREAWTCAFSLLVLHMLPIHLQGLHLTYDTLACTLHVHKLTVQPVASHSLFLDIQVVTLMVL